MKIGFFFKNASIYDIDMRRPDLGNPGCGGRQYMNAMNGYQLAALGDPNIEPMFFSETKACLPEGIASVITGDQNASLRSAQSEGIEYFIVDCSQTYELVDQALNIAEASDLKLVFRLGLTPSSRSLHRIASSPAAAAVVCVDHECYDLIRDHPVISKTTVIVNAAPTIPFGEPLPYSERQKLVVYLGSLVPQKGFGVLARAWPLVLNKVQDARLRVIGSGKVYARDAELGEWAVASETFEAREIRPFLSDKNGAPHPSVEFLGKMGAEKIGHLKQAMVGIANPTGRTERCSSASLEIQAAGTAVVAGGRDGLFDTVRHRETGFLVRGPEELARRITELLSSPENAETMGNAGRAFVERCYDPALVAQKWRDLFYALERGDPPSAPRQRPKPSTFETAFVRANGRFRDTAPVSRIWPDYLAARDLAQGARRGGARNLSI